MVGVRPVCLYGTLLENNRNENKNINLEVFIQISIGNFTDQAVKSHCELVIIFAESIVPIFGPRTFLSVLKYTRGALYVLQFSV